MSFVSGTYIDNVKADDGMMTYLTPPFAAEQTYGGFIEGEIAHMSPPNAKGQIMIDTPLGKGSGIFFGFLWQMRKLGFYVQKVSEWIEVSPVHSQYYQLTTQQKQTLEGQIKSALHSVHTSISDFELLQHDMRRYREYMNYFENVERARKEKNDKDFKTNNQTLKSIFIDQVDVHTGEGVALKLIASRWPTIIVDFMRINDEDVDPRKMAKDYGFSEAEGVVLATKNKIYLQWRGLFKETVTSRYSHLKELIGARKLSIEEYRNMVKPYVMRHKMIHEFGETSEGRATLQNFAWWRPATQAVSIESAEYWMWKPFFPPEIHRPSLQYRKEKLPVLKMPFPQPMLDDIKANYQAVKDAKFENVETFLTGAEPADKWVWFLMMKMQEWYKKKFNYRATLNSVDVLEARKTLANQYAEYSRWDWQPSPYFVTLEMPTLRIVVRNPDGTESETFIFGSYPDRPMMAPLETQNVVLLRLLEMRLQNKELENYVTDMVGESVDGKKLEDAVKEDYPYLMGDGKSAPKSEGGVKLDFTNKEYMKKIDPREMSRFRRNIRFVKPGPYEVMFMERTAAIMVKEITQSTYAFARGYIKSAVGAG